MRARARPAPGRGRPRSLLVVCALAGAALQAPEGVAAADSERGVVLGIEGDGALAVGPARLEVSVRLSPDQALPLLLDVTSEGDALQVVRGRFRRSDARRAPDGSLRFSVPIVVRGQGSAGVRAELRTYLCEGDCRELRAEARRTVVVGPSPGRDDAKP